MRSKTDLILEVASLATSKTKGYTKEYKKFKSGLFYTSIKINSKEGSKFFDRPLGEYITLECKDMLLDQDKTKIYIAKFLTTMIKKLIKNLSLKKVSKIFIVGLGNKEITPDSLGPKVCDKLIITRHLKEVVTKEFNIPGLNSISSLSAGVLGTTGIETSNIIKALLPEVMPDLIVVIDTLSTFKASRMATTFQLSSCGLTPGAGVDNPRKSIDYSTMGVPVIAIGVPFVVHAGSIAKETLDAICEKERLVKKEDENFEKKIKKIFNDLIFTAKDIDKAVENCSFIIALALNIAFLEALDVHQILDYMN